MFPLPLLFSRHKTPKKKQCGNNKREISEVVSKNPSREKKGRIKNGPGVIMPSSRTRKANGIRLVFDRSHGPS